MVGNMAQILLFLESGLLWNTNESEKKLDGSESEGSIRGSTEELEGDQWTPVTYKRPPWRYPPHLRHLSENLLDSESIQVLYHHVINPNHC